MKFSKLQYIYKTQAKISAKLRSRNERIFPIATIGIFNFRCHQNCVQYVTDNPDKGLEVVECIYLHQGDPEQTILHYVVRNKEGQYLEVTLGYETSQHEYYFIRKVPEVEYAKITDVFFANLKTWLHEYTNPVLRFIYRLDRIL